jgi:hypothetical protein
MSSRRRASTLSHYWNGADLNRARRHRKGIAALVTAAAIGTVSLSACDEDNPVGIDTDELELHTTMRTLLAEHMEWTWATVEAFATNSASLQPTINRLLDNQRDIGAAIVPYYGQSAGNQLTDLLLTHINQAVPVLTAARNGNQVALQQALANWYANAQQIADFLTQANPDNWPSSVMRPAWEMHIDQTVVYATDILTGDYPAAIQAFDEARVHMAEEVADVLATGIIEQFPDEFD